MQHVDFSIIPLLVLALTVCYLLLFIYCLFDFKKLLLLLLLGRNCVEESERVKLSYHFSCLMSFLNFLKKRAINYYYYYFKMGIYILYESLSLFCLFSMQICTGY